MGPSSLLYKINLKSAADYLVLALKWRKNTFIDVGIPFGLKQGASMWRHSVLG